MGILRCVVSADHAEGITQNIGISLTFFHKLRKQSMKRSNLYRQRSIQIRKEVKANAENWTNN
jgi:hypothetical protein